MMNLFFVLLKLKFFPSETLLSRDSIHNYDSSEGMGRVEICGFCARQAAFNVKCDSMEEERKKTKYLSKEWMNDNNSNHN